MDTIINEQEKFRGEIDDAFKNIFWVDECEEFKINSEYPTEFEQKFGNISSGMMRFNAREVNIKRIDDFHQFLSKWGFKHTQQYSLIEYTTGYYYSDDLIMVLRCNFGNPNIKKEGEEEDEDGDPLGVETGSLAMSFCPLKGNREKIENFIDEFIELDIMFTPTTEKCFYMVAEGQNGLYKQKTTFNNINIKDDRYDLYYGEKFPHDKFLKFVREDTENLLLLHGDPGTGKSNYIKNLITMAEEDIIYIPPSMVSIIASPGFVSFMLGNKNNIILIEDAEEILSSDRNSATNNLLGLTDGFLKDALNLKIICTFNCDLSDIDEALRRKGRLYFEYKFDKLSVEEGRKLADFCDLGIDITEELTLAEIFNYEKEITVKDSFEKRSIGFLP